MSYYTNMSFTPSKAQGSDNIACSWVFDNPLDTQIVAKLVGYPNIICAKLYTLLLAIEHTKLLNSDMYIFKNNLIRIYVLINHVQHPSSQYKHMNKLLISHKNADIKIPNTK